MRAIAAAFLALSVLAIAAGCGDGDEHSVVGVIIDVQATSLTDIDSFTLRSDDGESLRFLVAPDADPDPQEGFVPGHLRTHALAAEKVKITYREEAGELLALRLEDQ